MVEHDLGLQNPENYSWTAALDNWSTMMTLSFEYLAANEKSMTFMHSFPGLVRTENFNRMASSAPASVGSLGRFLVALAARFAFTMQWLLGVSALDSGASAAFLLCSDRYGPGECWRIDQKNEPFPPSRVLEEYRERGWREKVWEHTAGVFEKALAADEEPRRQL